MCTGIRLTAKSGAVVSGRTMEFGIDLESEVMMSPRNVPERIGTTPDGLEGLHWTPKYASVGVSGLELDVLVDGFNEKGLAAALFYFPGYAKYMDYEKADADRTIASWELPSWILDNFASVEEVRAKVATIVVADAKLKAWNITPPFHFVVHDASGKSIVIEYVDHKLNVHDNPLGVITNSPSFDWHMTNLNNYVNYSFTNLPPVKLGTVPLAPFGQGSGMLGLPGDITPPSRFVRAVAFSQSVWQSKTGGDAVLEAFHVLNNFDIPKGAARDAHTNDGVIEADYTLWTSANDLEKRRFYFRTYDNSQIRMVDLMKMDLDAKVPIKISMKGEEVIKPVTPLNEALKNADQAA